MTKQLLITMLCLLAAGVVRADYSKIANNGWELPASAALGSGDFDWACTRDDAAGLVWEVKTDDGGLRDKDITYTNYDDLNKPQKWNGSAYVSPTQTEIDAATNSIGFVNAVNAIGLCGHTDWRRPSMEELHRLLLSGQSPAIDIIHFPNTPEVYFWSATSFDPLPGTAWEVYFYDGGILTYGRDHGDAVRLVRSGQSVDNFDLTITPTGSGSGTVVIGGVNAACSGTAGIPSGICALRPANGATVTLTATADSGNVITWGGACTGVNGDTCTLIMDMHQSVMADFSPPPITSALLVDPDSTSTLYAGLDGAGVYVTTDSGANWSEADTQPAHLGVRVLAKRSGTPLYVGTDGGVFSAPAGTDFIPCATQPENTQVSSLVLDADGILFAGTAAGVFVSADQCATWSALNNGLPY